MDADHHHFDDEGGKPGSSHQTAAVIVSQVSSNAAMSKKKGAFQITRVRDSQPEEHYELDSAGSSDINGANSDTSPSFSSAEGSWSTVNPKEFRNGNNEHANDGSAHVLHRDSVEGHIDDEHSHESATGSNANTLSGASRSQFGIHVQPNANIHGNPVASFTNSVLVEDSSEAEKISSDQALNSSKQSRFRVVKVGANQPATSTNQALSNMSNSTPHLSAAVPQSLALGGASTVNKKMSAPIGPSQNIYQIGRWNVVDLSSSEGEMQHGSTLSYISDREREGSAAAFGQAGYAQPSQPPLAQPLVNQFQSGVGVGVMNSNPQVNQSAVANKQSIASTGTASIQSPSVPQQQFAPQLHPQAPALVSQQQMQTQTQTQAQFTSQQSIPQSTQYAQNQAVGVVGVGVMYQLPQGAQSGPGPGVNAVPVGSQGQWVQGPQSGPKQVNAAPVPTVPSQLALSSVAIAQPQQQQQSQASSVPNTHMQVPIQVPALQTPTQTQAQPVPIQAVQPTMMNGGGIVLQQTGQTQAQVQMQGQPKMNVLPGTLQPQVQAQPITALAGLTQQGGTALLNSLPQMQAQGQYVSTSQQQQQQQQSAAANSQFINVSQQFVAPASTPTGYVNVPQGAANVQTPSMIQPQPNPAAAMLAQSVVSAAVNTMSLNIIDSASTELSVSSFESRIEAAFDGFKRQLMKMVNDELAELHNDISDLRETRYQLDHENVFLRRHATQDTLKMVDQIRREHNAHWHAAPVVTAGAAAGSYVINSPLTANPSQSIVPQSSHQPT